MDAVIVIGPPRSGKTLNREAIAKAYGCEKIYDAGEYELKTATGRVLVLAQEHPGDPAVETRARSAERLAKVPRMPGRVVTIDEAKKACGAAWLEPKI